MKLITAVYLLLLLIDVSQSPSTGDKDESDSVMSRAHDVQVQMGYFLERLLEDGEITKSRVMWQGKEHNLYEFTGEAVRKLELKYVFDMLQNWNWYVQKQADEFRSTDPLKYEAFFNEINLFKLNFGDGEAKLLGLQVSKPDAEHGANAIQVFDSDKKAREYDDIYKVFEDSGLPAKTIAKYIIEAVDKSTNDQPDWSNANLDDNLRYAMLQFATIAESAEGARPSDQFFNDFKKASVDVYQKLKTDDAIVKWTKGFRTQLEKVLYDVPDDLFTTTTETYWNFVEKLNEYDKNYKARTGLRNRLKRLEKERKQDTGEYTNKKNTLAEKEEEQVQILEDLRDMLPNHVTEFYDRLVAAKLAGGDDGVLDFLKADDKYTVNDEFKLVKLNAAIDNYAHEKSNTNKRRIEDCLPPAIHEYLAGKMIQETLKQCVSKKENLVSKKELRSTGDAYKPTGRIPGAGYLARALLQKIVDEDIKSWEEFNRIFVVSQKDGLVEARKSRLLYDIQSRPEEIYARSAFESDSQKFKLNHYNAYYLEEQAALYATKEQSSAGSGSSCDLLKRKKRADACTSADSEEKIIDDSVQWDGDNVHFQTVDDQGIIKTYEMEVPVDEMAISKYYNERTATAHEVTEKIGTGIGVYGTLVNGLTSAEQIMNGNYGQGAFSAAQTLHSIGGLTGFNTKIQKIIVRKAWNTAAEKYGFERVSEELAEPIAREAGKAAETLARFMEDIPFVGLSFDIYFITQDIKALTDDSDKTPEFLKVAHLVLDVEVTVLTLVETFVPVLAPVIEPIVIALTIIRISIDDFYYDIKRELDKVKGADFGTQLLAFMKGFEEGIGDVLTLGLISQLNEMDDALEYQSKLWQNMSDPRKYFNQTLAGHGDIDFNGGIMSGFGGFLSVTLNENGSFTMELPEVYIGETPRSIKKTFEYATPANEIVLGIGEVKSPQYIHKEVKLWLFIPVTSYDIVSNFLGHESSLYGRYYGNSFDNAFYTIQQDLTKEDYSKVIGHECDTDKLNPSDFNKLLEEYEYDLYGHGGNDKFYLGPQAATILGGDGKDLYYIPVTGGRTVINNFALDEELDTLFMNMTYSDITCHRYEHDLIVTYCDTHVVKAEHWFVHGDENSNYFRHINIVTNDEVVLDVVDTDISSDGEYQVTCYPVLIDRSRSKAPVTIDLSVGTLSHVVNFVGTNFTDTVTGNDNNNQIRGGLGDDALQGGKGEDSYIHTEGDGRDLINNYSNDLENDTVFIGINFDEVSVSRSQDSLTLINRQNSLNSITMLNWYLGPEYQHTLFMSKDYVSFYVLGEQDNPVKYPVNIDFGQSEEGVNLNLTSENVAQGFKEVTAEMVNDIQVIIDSPHDDVIVGNVRNNIMTCTGESDRLQGSSGSDTYVAKDSCKSLEIVNNDSFKSVDLLLLNCSSSVISLSIDGSNLNINYQQNQEQHIVKLINWFDSGNNQHLMVKTQDKWTFLPPKTLESFKTYIEPFQIETSDSCNGGVEEYDFNQSPFLELQRFLANDSNCRFVIKGNSQNNYIDPGPSDSYGYQVLTGGNGSDTYVFGHNYGVDNAIHNYATDGEYDHLLFNVIYKDIHVEQINDDIVLSSISVNNSVEVSLHNYTIGEEYQHIFIHASDGIIFQVKIRNFAVSKEISLIDYSESQFSQIISAATDDPSYAHVRGIFGSQVEENEIHGGNETMKLVGGNNDDKIYGGNLTVGEDINGLDGNDYIDGGGGDDSISGGDGNDTIFGGDGDDDIYAGKGADYIDGGDGNDTIIFSGNGTTATGVLVNLIFGVGLYGDADGDTYVSIETISGSQFNDTLIGDGGDNTIRGNGGYDYIVPGGGFDLLDGGLDGDIYDMTESFGFKVINNFASDKVLDTVLFSDVEFDDMCYYFLDNDLYIITSYINTNYSRAMERVMLDQGYLEVQLLYWLGNETYRHIALMFVDAFVYPEDNFTAIDRDFSEISAELQDQTMSFLSVSLITESSISLDIKFTSINSSNPLPDDAQLYYMHLYNGENTTLNPLYLNYDENSAYNNSITVDGLESGVRQYFMILLTICEAKATISSMLTVITLPNPPISVSASVIPGGFEVNWTAPDNETNPYVFFYNYTIQYWKTEDPDEVYTIEYDDVLSYTTYDIVSSHIHPDKDYVISIYSRYNETISQQFALSDTITAGDSVCSNFNSLPDHMYIDSIELVNDNSRAYLACDDNYEVIGQNYLDCNVPVLVAPICKLIYCNAVYEELKSNSVQESVASGETNQWTCYDHYELAGGENTYTSTCYGSTGWDPPLQTCVEKPACSPYPSVYSGFIQPSFAYRDEEITFSCKDNYSRDGPEKKTCVAPSSGEEAPSAFNNIMELLNRYNQYSPLTPVQCIRNSCPELIPQPNGKYSLPNGNFEDRIYQSGEVVNLKCNTGYYIRDDQTSPDTQTLTCTIEGHWSIEQQVCQPLIYFKNVNQYLNTITGEMNCQVPQWYGCSFRNLDFLVSVTKFACSILGGHKFEGLTRITLRCSTLVKFEHHPPLSNGNTNTNAGRLTIKHPDDSTDTVCPNNPSDLGAVCGILGISSQYTQSLINVGGYHTTREFTSLSSPLTSKSQTCTKMISCRGTCDPLHVSGLASQCDKVLEGETCYLDCLPGSTRIGPREKVCQSNEKWSGESTSCDADQWKSDADNIVQVFNHLYHLELAHLLVEKLSYKYPDVTWVAMVYDPVSGFDKHTLYHSGSYTYSHFRYYNKNFMVGRYITHYVSRSFGLANELATVSEDAAKSCKRYCHDPACWSPYYRINAEGAAKKIYDGLRSKFSVHLAMVVQGGSAKLLAARKRSNGGMLYYAKLSRTAEEVYWDRRIAQTILVGCDGVAVALVMAD